MKNLYTANPVHILKRYALYICLLAMPALWAQDFTLSVQPTDESCDGHGSLSFSIQNAPYGTPVNFKVYLLPDTVNPISDNSGTSVTGLQAGTYLIKASQTGNGATVTDEQEAVINDVTVPLQYYISNTNALCGDDGSITVNVTSGNAVTYEIYNGPVTVPPQTSNVFNNIPAGTYQIRVVDNCGDGKVKTNILFTDGPVLQVTGPGFPDTALPGCDLITLSYSVMAEDPDNAPIPYPLTAHYTIYLPDNSTPLEYDAVITSGDAESVTITQVIPFYYDTLYYADVVVTDPCGVEYEVLHGEINQHLSGILSFSQADCGNYTMIMNVFKYGPPYEVNFIQWPEDLNPADFNADYPGPYTDDEIFFGDEENTLPFGIYEYIITDNCGRTYHETIELEVPDDPEPEILVYNLDCLEGLGGFEAAIPKYGIETFFIVAAPQEYTDMLPEGETLPKDLSYLINEDDEIRGNNLPPGSYNVEITDKCGNFYEVTMVIPPFNAGAIVAQGRPDCTPGKSTVNLLGGVFTSVKITASPTAFSDENTLPYDVSFNIAENGGFYMDNLPPGTYTFKTDTQCTNDEVTITLNAYTVTQNEINITKHCGSFDLTLNHSSNGVAFVGFWLQKLIDPENDIWGHPVTNTPYELDTEPDADNAIELTNNSTLYNQTATGSFRVIKYFVAYTSGSQGTVKECFEVLYEFDFTDSLELIDINSLTCAGTTADVEVLVDGATPIEYWIIKKNNQEFNYYNGQSNIFYGLENAEYTLHIEDPCGSFIEPVFSVAELPSLVNAIEPSALQVCDNDADNEEIFDLSAQDDIIMDGQDPDIFYITYHETVEDAEGGINPLPDVIASGNATVFARVTHSDNPNGCYAITSFPLELLEPPVIEMDDVWVSCLGEEITLTAEAGYEQYEWSTGETTQAITTKTEGDYTVTVTDENGCMGSKTVNVVHSSPPAIASIEVEDWTDNDNIITVLTDQPDSITQFYEYSLNGVNYQQSNVFTGLAPGIYLVYVRDTNGCGDDAKAAHVLTYPKYFTPNGDNTHETWRIQYGIAEPDLMVHIYDRYGKLITGFDANSPGWDGTLNGKQLPSTDYWFVVKRQNGKEFRGHFSLIR